MGNAPRLFDLAALPRQSLFGGSFTRTAVKSEGSIVTVNWITPGVPRLPPHQHPFDQLSFVFEGTMVFEIDGRTYELGPGTAILIPPHALHTAWIKGTETVLNVDVFSPSRADYLFLAAHQDSEGKITP